MSDPVVCQLDYKSIMSNCGELFREHLRNNLGASISDPISLLPPASCSRDSFLLTTQTRSKQKVTVILQGEVLSIFHLMKVLFYALGEHFQLGMPRMEEH